MWGVCRGCRGRPTGVTGQRCLLLGWGQVAGGAAARQARLPRGGCEPTKFRSGAASAALRTACSPRAQYTMSLFELPARCTLVESALTIRGGPSGFRGAPPAQPAWPGHADLAHQPALRGRPAWQPSGPGAACPRGWTPGQACRCITPSAPRTPQGTSPPTSRRCKALRRPASCAACARRRGRQGHMRVATATASCSTSTVSYHQPGGGQHGGLAADDFTLSETLHPAPRSTPAAEARQGGVEGAGAQAAAPGGRRL